MNKEIPIFDAVLDERGDIKCSLSKEVTDRLEKVMIRFGGRMATKELLGRICQDLECEIRNIIWENDSYARRGW